MHAPSSEVGSRVRLREGRWLGYAEYGVPDGEPILYLPGAPSSRLMHPPDETTRAQGARLIVVERPGYGLSDFQPRRRLLDWPGDVAALADALDIGRFAVVGSSAGGPYAAACAFKIPERLTCAAIVCGVGPVWVPGGLREMPHIRQTGAILARYAPGLLEPLLRTVGNPHRNPERFYRRMLAGNSDADRQFLTRPDMQAMLMRNYLEATRSGMRGFARDAIILSNPWGFRLQDIRIPVFLWHGLDDANVSLAAARHVAQAIPDCRATFVSGEGHWLVWTHWEAILSTIMR